MIAIYTRQSVDKKDSISIETQIELCKKEIPDGHELMVYQDKGFSGKNIIRPAFKKMMEAVEKGSIQKVVVYRLDRFSRSITDFANLIGLLDEHNVDFISANEKFDTSTPVGRAMLYIVMVFAQLERETIAERIKDNYYARGQHGVWLGGPAPLGYTIGRKLLNGKNTPYLIPNTDIEIIKEIFNLYANTNLSLGGIAKEYRQRYSGTWNNIKIARIIHNPAYVRADIDIYHYYQKKKCIIVNDVDNFTGVYGCSLYGKRDRGAGKYNALDDNVLSIALHEGVVDSTTWLKCQYKSDMNVQIKNTGKGKHSWLTGSVKCGYCGHGMVVKVYKETFKYLVCTGRYTTDECQEKLSTHHLKDIEEYVETEILSYIGKHNTSGILTLDNATQNDSNDLKIDLHKVETEIERLVSTLDASNEVLMKYINKKIIELDNKKNALLEKLNQQAIAPQSIVLPDVTNWHQADLNFKRSVAQQLISKIILFNEKIEVVWKI